MSGFKETRRGVETIKKIREREIRCLEAMVGDHGPHPHRNSLTSHFFSRDLDGNETRPSIKPFPLQNMCFTRTLQLKFYFILVYFFFLLLICLLHWDHGPRPHRNPLTSRSFLRDLDGNETRPSIKSFLYRTCFFARSLQLKFYLFIFILSMNG